MKKFIVLISATILTTISIAAQTTTDNQAIQQWAAEANKGCPMEVDNGIVLSYVRPSYDVLEVVYTFTAAEQFDVLLTDLNTQYLFALEALSSIRESILPLVSKGVKGFRVISHYKGQRLENYVAAAQVPTTEVFKHKLDLKEFCEQLHYASTMSANKDKVILRSVLYSDSVIKFIFFVTTDKIFEQETADENKKIKENMQTFTASENAKEFAEQMRQTNTILKFEYISPSGKLAVVNYNPKTQNFF